MQTLYDRIKMDINIEEAIRMLPKLDKIPIFDHNSRGIYSYELNRSTIIDLFKNKIPEISGRIERNMGYGLVLSLDDSMRFMYIKTEKKGENMSYNCDAFKVKKLKNLKIPIKYLLNPEKIDWAFEREENYNENNEIESTTFTNMYSNITGTIEKGILIVKEIDISGEGSGVIFYEILEEALKNSTGELIASCVWEGGDSINQLLVKEGNVSWKDIDI